MSSFQMHSQGIGGVYFDLRNSTDVHPDVRLVFRLEGTI